MSDASDQKHEQLKGDGPKELPIPAHVHTLVIQLNTQTNELNVNGAISNVGICYQMLGMAKDVIREWNRLNNGYLAANKTPKPGIMERVLGKHPHVANGNGKKP